MEFPCLTIIQARAPPKSFLAAPPRPSAQQAPARLVGTALSAQPSAKFSEKSRQHSTGLDAAAVSARLLALPPRGRTHLLSPPPSPPSEWVQSDEDGPNSVAYVDLTPTPIVHVDSGANAVPVPTVRLLEATASYPEIVITESPAQ
jgi:hypothetical protein